MYCFRDILVLIFACFLQTGFGQEPPSPSQETVRAETLVVPQLRAIPSGNETRDLSGIPGGRADVAAEFKGLGTAGGGNGRIMVPSVSADVKIKNSLADTRLDFRCVNPGNQSVNAPIAVPLPRSYKESKQNSPGSENSNEMLSAKEALPVWRNLAKSLANPAPLEFCGSPLLRTSPIDLSPGESQPVAIEYAQTLSQQGPRFDYVLPKSESVQNTAPWTLRADVSCDRPISTIYCPSHKIKAKRTSPNTFHVELDAEETTQPGSFRLSYLIDKGTGLSATLFTQPDDATPQADGTFLFLAGGPATGSLGKAIPRELTLALDRSGSMQGAKIDHVKDAATQLIEQLNDGESFNIISYNDQIETFADKPVPKTRETLAEALEFIDNVRPRGGTNLHGALLESVRQKPVANTLPIVLFLTDGLPTVGETAEVKIREVVAEQNPFNRRIFTVGVGVDVNTPLLETIAGETRAEPSFVLPNDDVKTKLAQIFQKVQRPILADARLEFLAADGSSAADRVSDVFPDPLPDLFQDDHLIVLGRYTGTEPLTFQITGNFLGDRVTKDFTFPLDKQPAYPFVSRLWATQKIAALVHEIRKSGANADPYVILTNPTQDPKLKAQAEEILKLTRRYGILTEYTAFLAKDGLQDLSQREQVEMAYRNFDERAVKTRVGLSSVNQSINNSLLKQNYFLNGANYYWDKNMRRVGIPNVQQMEGGAYFLRGTTWIDGRLVDRPNLTPNRTVQFGTPAYEKLVNRLVENGEHTPLSLEGNVLIEIDKQPVLIQAPQAATTPMAPAHTGTAKQVPKR